MKCHASRTLLFTLLAGGAVVLAAPARAQLTTGGVGSGQPAPMPKLNDDTPKQAPAPALPGSHAEPMAVAPPDRLPSDMAPTDALFDAINRGDMAAARDALSRGADLNGHNLLGMTPLELSVDLGRNEISFLLLSMRGSSPPPTTKVAAATPAAPLRGHRPRRETREVEAAAPMPAPRLGGNGGTPVPAAGFLGFGPVGR